MRAKVATFKRKTLNFTWVIHLLSSILPLVFNIVFNIAKCLKLKDIYSLETAKLMYKIHNNVLSFANSDKFNLIKNCYTHKTRLSHKNNFFLPRTRTRLGKSLYHSQELKFGMKFQAVWKKFHSTDLKKLLKLIFYQTMKPIKARITAFYQQCSSKYRNHSCIFMLEFNNNLFYCLNSMSLVHSSITHLLQYVISHFDVPLNWLVLEIVPVLMTYWQTIQNKARRFFFHSNCPL